MPHTPGPWQHELNEDENTFYVGNIADTQNKNAVARVLPVRGNIEANARLIAAAPDLLASLEALVHRMKSDGYDQDGFCRPLLEAAQHHIAKAKGENTR